MNLTETQPVKALGAEIYVQGDQRSYTVGPFLDDKGIPLKFADDTVEVLLRPAPDSPIYVKHSATNPTTVASNGISTDGRGRLRYTLFASDMPISVRELRLQVVVRRRFNDSASNPKVPYTVTLGEGDMLVRPKLA
jgi:hypothetical protein